MAFALDNSANASGNGTNTVTVSYSPVSATNNILIVIPNYNTVTGITYNGVALNFIANSGNLFGIWYLTGVPTGAHNLVVSSSGISPAAGGISILTFTGAHQTLQPVAANHTNPTTGLSTSASVSITNAGSLVVDYIGVQRNSPTGSDTITPSNSQTSYTFSSGGYDNSIGGYLLNEAVGTRSYGYSYALDSSADYGVAVFNGTAAVPATSVSDSATASDTKYDETVFVTESVNVSVSGGTVTRTINVSDSSTVTEAINFNYRAQDIRDDISNQTVNADFARWNTFATSTSISRANGVLSFTTTTSTGYAGYTSATQVNLTGSQATVQVISIGNQALTSYEIFPIQLYSDSNNKLFWYINQGFVQTYTKVGGTQVQRTSVAWDANAYRFLRIRESGGTTFFERSPDFVTWTVEFSIANPLPMAPFWFEPTVGTFNPEASGTTAVLDNINTTPFFFTESVSTSEATQVVITSRPSVSDATTVSEAVSVFIPGGGVFVSESTALTETVTVKINTSISVSDSTTLTEAVVAAHPTNDLFDDFNDNTQNTTLWVAISGSGREVETNRQLQLSSTVGATTYAGYQAVRYYDLTGSRIFSQVIDVGNQSIASFQAVPILLFADASNGVAWYINANKIVAQKQVAGSYTDVLATTTYDPTVHKFFSIRESAGTTFWDFSTDGVTWTNYTSQASPVPLNHVQPEVIAGTFNTEVTGTTAIFDNYNIIRDRFVTVSEATTLTESVTVTLPVSSLTVSVSDATTLTETITMRVTNFVSVSDATTLTETITARAFNFISVSDASTVSETLTLNELAFISVSDATTLTESVTALIVSGLLTVSVSDGITTSESLTELLLSFISVADTISSSDTATASISTTISVSESTALTESLAVVELVSVSVTDASTVTETVTVYTPLYFVSVSDSSTLTEVVSIQDQEGVSVSDATALTETVTVYIPFVLVTVSDATTLTETVKLLSTSFVSVSDATTVTETITARVLAFVSVSDSSAVTETVSVASPLLISVSDSSTLSETVTILYTITISKQEFVGVLETVQDQQQHLVPSNLFFGNTSIHRVAQTFTPAVTGNHINFPMKLANAFLSTDNIVMKLYTDGGTAPGTLLATSDNSFNGANLDWHDSYYGVVFNFNAGVALTAGTKYWLELSRDGTYDDSNDWIVPYNNNGAGDKYTGGQLYYTDASDVWQTFGFDYDMYFFDFVASSIKVAEIFAGISVSDSTTLTESVSIAVGLAAPLAVSVSDSSTVTETVALTIPLYFITVSDSSTVSEAITMQDQDGVVVTDATALSETVTMLIPVLPLSVSDASTVTETVSITNVYGVKVTDASTVTETVTATIPFYLVSVTDASTLSETLNVTNAYTVSVSESTTISETIAAAISTSISVSDATTLTETITVRELSFISVSDSSTVSETVTVKPPTITISVSDSAFTNESVSVAQVSFFTVTNSPTNDTQQLYSGAGYAWSPTGNVYALDAAYASASPGSLNAGASKYLIANGYGFAIPAGATILGVKATVYADDNQLGGQASNVSVLLFSGTTSLGGTDLTTGATTAGSITAENYGSSSNLWGLALTPSIINDTNFGFGIVYNMNANEKPATFVNVDYMPMSVTYSVTGTLNPAINVNDSSTLSETVSVAVPFAPASTSDSATVSETLNVLLVSLASVSDSTTTSETVSVTSLAFVSVSDATTLTETLKLQPVSFISVADSTTVTETITINETVYFIAVSDSSTVSESIQIQDQEGVFVTDATTLTESVTLLIPTLFASVSDASTVTETVKTTLLSLVSVSDNTTVTETVAVNELVAVSVSEATTVTETVAVNIQGTGVFVSDSAATSETVNVFQPFYALAVNDSSTVTETVTLLAVEFVSVSDSTTVTEAVLLTVVSLISVADSTTLTETISVNELVTISVNDNATLSEVVPVNIPGGGIFVTENVTTAEVVTVVASAAIINVSDSTATSETINQTLVFSVQVMPGIQMITGVKIVG
jgi:hypothetical protein